MATLKLQHQAITQTVGGNNEQARSYYVVHEAADESEVRTQADLDLPIDYDGMPLQSYDITDRINDTTWRIEALYAPIERSPTDAPSRAFDTTGATSRVTQSISTVDSYPAGAPDFQGAIGFDGENVQGVDVIEPSFALNETHYYSNSTVTESFMQNLHNLTGKVNNASFRGWAAGEVLFVGVIANRRPDTVWEIDYQFQARRNQTGVTVGSITGIDKKGWEYLWVRYGKDVSGTSRIQIPQYVYVEQVYELGDFTSLGLGSW